METRGDHEAQVHGAASDDELNDDSSDTDDSSETSVPAKYCFTAGNSGDKRSRENSAH